MAGCDVDLRRRPRELPSVYVVHHVPHVASWCQKQRHLLPPTPAVPSWDRVPFYPTTIWVGCKPQWMSSSRSLLWAVRETCPLLRIILTIVNRGDLSPNSRAGNGGTLLTDGIFQLGFVISQQLLGNVYILAHANSRARPCQAKALIARMRWISSIQ